MSTFGVLHILIPIRICTAECSYINVSFSTIQKHFIIRLKLHLNKILKNFFTNDGRLPLLYFPIIIDLRPVRRTNKQSRA